MILIPVKTDWSDEIAGFLIHELMAVILCPLVTFLAALVVGLRAFHLSPSLYALLFKSLFSPIYWGAGALVGFQLNRRAGHYSARWVWVLPILTVSLLLTRYSVPPTEYYGLLLTCRDECIAAMFLTVPTMNSIAYSIGAWLAIRYPRNPRGAS